MQSRLYLPQAGSTSMVAVSSDSGWALRQPNGRLLYFNKLGYLVKDVDRFGNGFSVEYETTPLFDMYDEYCRKNFASGLETRRSRRCAVLAYLLEDAPRPEWSSEPWEVTESDYPLPAGSSIERLAYARSYFLSLLGRGPGSLSTFGGRWLRPTRVTDDLGRSLAFIYYKASLIAATPLPTYDFVHAPSAELLKEVDGPAGTRVRFSYSRPAGYPSELNEMFLARVERHDTQVASDVHPAPDRSRQYLYQWPTRSEPAYAALAGRVYSIYSSFYSTFVGCIFQSQYVCGKRSLPSFARGDPMWLAQLERAAYISDVADNIIEVLRDGRIESETRYRSNPWSGDFDRVIAQRYGTSSARQVISRVAPDNRANHWQSALPKLTISYVLPGPLGQGGDSTDLTLPPAIRARYPLETAPGGLVVPPLVPPAVGATDARQPRIKACNYALMEERRRWLPGYRETLAYFNVDSSEMHPDFAKPLRRSRLSCGQLAIAQLADPTHNDLLSTLVHDPTSADPRSRVLVRLVGRRRYIAANANRICSWTKVVDRDGDVHYYGLNYRGEVLVDAVQVRGSSDFIFRERLVNADGMVVQERRPTRGHYLRGSASLRPQPWTVAFGYTTYQYDEVDPAGHLGWSDWLPVFWARRMNLLRVQEQPAGLTVLDAADAPSQGFVKTAGRFRHIEYEPLFNQVRLTEEGILELQSSSGAGSIPKDVVLSRVRYIFDYQELDSVSSTNPAILIDSVLRSLEPWGFQWLTKADGAFDYGAIRDWQLPLTLYGRDLNGDGERGYPYGKYAFQRAKGLAVLVQQDPLDATVDPLVRAVIWAPHGLPAVVRDETGAMTEFAYYPDAGSATGTALYGGTQRPTDQDLSPGYRGLLGRIRIRRFVGGDTLRYGPHEGPCAALAGPYQWLLPATCSTEPRAQLVALGLPPQMVDAIIAATDTLSPDQWRATTYSYSEIGSSRYEFNESGQWHVVHDADGRDLEETDPIGTRTTNAYTTDGLPWRTLRIDRAGRLLRATYRKFDEDGRVTYRCLVLVQGGCVKPQVGTHPTAAEWWFEYWPEGALRTVVDPEGLRKSYSYNEQQLVVQERTDNAKQPSFPRFTSYTYSDDGDVTSVRYGSPPMHGRSGLSLEETFSYDGLRRLVARRDTRQYSWVAAYSRRDSLAGVKSDSVLYGASVASTPAWAVELRYDAFGRLVRRLDNGILTALYQRTKAGSVFRFSATGEGETFTTYDLSGAPVWTRDPAGTQVVKTVDLRSMVRSTAVIRADGKGQRVTTATVDSLDVMGRPFLKLSYGGSNVQTTRYGYDGTGLILEEWNPANHRRFYSRNLLGWPTEVAVQRTETTPIEFDAAIIGYNHRGDVTEVQDPNGQRSIVGYDPFGAVQTRVLPGDPPVVRFAAYDALGRRSLEGVGADTIVHVYDARGDRVSDSLRGGGIIAKWSFDELGRVREDTNFNPALGWLPPLDRIVSRRLDYDSLGRVVLDEVTVGTSGPHPVASHWSIVGDVWQRKMHMPLGATTGERWETYDLAGRLAMKEQRQISRALKTSFDWLGEIYAGRTQEQLTRSSPFREQQRTDQFGRPVSWTYTVIDLTQSLQPLDGAEGAAYCGGTWVARECGRPLLTVDVVRDVMGRVGSLQWTFGNPVFSGGGLVTAAHASPWRGYAYSPREQLDEVWENPGITATVSTAGITSGRITSADVRHLGVGSDAWRYLRERAVGSTDTIRNAGTGTLRWAITQGRGPGYQLHHVELDGTTRSLAHDATGSVRADGTRRYAFDPRGWLAAVLINNAVVEGYSYDAGGRLAGIYDAAGPKMSFAYDGDQMVAAYAPSGAPIWEAVWRPGLDRLIEWRDLTPQGIDHIPLIDDRNSVVGSWDPVHGRLTQTASYSPEGRLTLSDASGNLLCQEQGTGQICGTPSDIPFGFESAFRSRTTGLVYLRNRWYSTQLGQFISHDPLGHLNSYNLYAFAGWDPINRWDPYGLEAQGFAKIGQEKSSPYTPFNRPLLSDHNSHVAFGLPELQNPVFRSDFGAPKPPTKPHVGGPVGHRGITDLTSDYGGRPADFEKLQYLAREYRPTGLQAIGEGAEEAGLAVSVGTPDSRSSGGGDLGHATHWLLVTSPMGKLKEVSFTTIGFLGATCGAAIVETCIAPVRLIAPHQLGELEHRTVFGRVWEPFLAQYKEIFSGVELLPGVYWGYEEHEAASAQPDGGQEPEDH